MTSLLARILLAVMLFPLASAFYFVIVFMAMGGGRGRRSDEIAFLAASCLTATFVVIYWLRLWRNSVKWTRRRRMRTFLAGAGCVTGGIAIAFILSEVAGMRDASFGFFVCGLVSVVSWLPLTVVIWRETPTERAERFRQANADALFCPRCGYNMTGLNQARCPECGAQYTLNQLYAAQQHAEIGDAAKP